MLMNFLLSPLVPIDIHSRHRSHDKHADSQNDNTRIHINNPPEGFYDFYESPALPEELLPFQVFLYVVGGQLFSFLNVLVKWY